MVWHSHLFQNFSQFSRLDSISYRSEPDHLSLSEGLSRITICENTMQNSDTQVNFISLVLIYRFRACLLAEVLQSCLILRDSMDRSLSGSSVHGILQARILEWVAMPPPGDLPNPGIKPASLGSPALAGEFFSTSDT